MKKIILGILSILTLSYAEGTTQKMDNTYIIYIRQSYLSIPRLEMSETIDSVSYDFGDVKSILPYIGSVNYDSSSESSIKEASMVAGIYTSIGNASYLLELSYGYITTKYKEPTIDDLHQSDISLIYNRYYPNYMFRLGIHHIATNDTDLGATNVFIGAIGAYVFNGKDKYSYGLEGYYINYKDGHDDQGIKKISP